MEQIFLVGIFILKYLFGTTENVYLNFLLKVLVNILHLLDCESIKKVTFFLNSFGQFF